MIVAAYAEANPRVFGVMRRDAILVWRGSQTAPIGNVKAQSLSPRYVHVDTMSVDFAAIGQVMAAGHHKRLQLSALFSGRLWSAAAVAAQQLYRRR